MLSLVGKIVLRKGTL